MTASTSAEPRPYRWLLLGAVVFCAWGVMWYGFTLGVLLPEMRADLHMSAAQQGWLSSVFFAGPVLFTLPATRLLARFAPLHAMGVCFAGGTVCVALAAIAPGYWSQFALRLVASLVVVAITPIRTSVLAGWFQRSEIPRANGIFNSGFGAVQAAGLWTAGGLLTVVGGWREMVALFAALSALGAGLWALIAHLAPPPLLPPTPIDEQVAGRSWLRIALHREVLALCLIGVGGASTWAAFSTFWPTVAQEALGLSAASAGFVLGCTSAAVIPGSLLAATGVRMLRGRLPFLLVTTVAQVPTFALFVITGNVPLLVAIGLLQGLTWTYFPILLSVPFDIEGFGKSDVATATALFIVVNGAALTLAPSLAGLLSAVLPLRTVLMVFSLAPLLSVAGALLLGKERAAQRSMAAQ